MARDIRLSWGKDDYDKDDYLQRIPTLLLDRRSIDLSGAQEKEGHFHYKNFLRASK